MSLKTLCYIPLRLSMTDQYYLCQALLQHKGSSVNEFIVKSYLRRFERVQNRFILQLQSFNA